jgi:hypothetical protein
VRWGLGILAGRDRVRGKTAMNPALSPILYRQGMASHGKPYRLELYSCVDHAAPLWEITMSKAASARKGWNRSRLGSQVP